MNNSQYLTLGEAAKTLPTRPSTQTIFRWATKGCRGIRLESLRFGRRIVVTPEALEKFARQLAEVWEQGRTESPPVIERKSTRPRSAAKKEKAVQAAETRLRDRGVIT